MKKNSANNAPAGKDNTAATTAKAPVAKGHRQRGAGTVITAKAPITTHDGIVLKAHERLPFQILHEYCQREKRPNPRYAPNPPGIRLRVILPDPKNSKNDLVFAPVQTFDSESTAKDYAALLALYSLMKSIPLERRLPEPYATTWRNMVSNNSSGMEGNSNNSNNSNNNREEEVEVLPDFSSFKKDKNNSSKQNSKKEDEEDNDWLCGTCGAQNFAKLLNGNLRTKCFKCQAPKASAPVITTNISNNNNSTSSNSGKAPPKAVLQLTAQSAFASQAERDQAMLQQRQQSAQRTGYRDALQRANRSKTINISAALLDSIEAMLSLSDNSASSNNDNNSASNTANNIATLLEEYVDMIFFDTANQSTLQSIFSVSDEHSVTLDTVTSVFKEFIEHIVSSYTLQRGQKVSSKGRKSTKKGSDSEAELEAQSILSFCQTILSIDSLIYIHQMIELIILIVNNYINNEVDNAVSVRHQLIVNIFEIFIYEHFFSINQSSSTTSQVIQKHLTQSIFADMLIYAVNHWQLESIENAIFQQLIILFGGLSTSRNCYNTCNILISMYLLHPHILQDANKCDIDANSEDWIVSKYVFIVSQVLIIHRERDNNTLLSSLQAVMSTSASTNSNNNILTIQDEIMAMEAIILANENITLQQYTVESNSRYLVSMDVQVDSTIGTGDMLVSVSVLFPEYIEYPHPSDVDIGIASTSCPYIVINTLNTATDASTVSLYVIQQQLQDKVVELTEQCNLIVYDIYLYIKELFNQALSNDISTLSNGLLVTNKLLPLLPHNVDISSKIHDVISYTSTATLTQPSDSAMDVDDTTTIESSSSATVSSSKSKKTNSSRNKHNNTHAKKSSFWNSSLSSNSSASHVKPIAALRNNSEYTANQIKREQLPANTKRADFLRSMKQCRAMIVTGETGCGKTTQIPQYLIEQDENSSDKNASNEIRILVCQPRRLAALSVAHRVAEEQGCKIGDLVGYSIKGDNKSSVNTRILFVTYGILLKHLTSDPLLQSIDYLVLDEIHERGVDSDFALSLILQAMKVRKSLKLILMSATISTTAFQDYLAKELYSNENNSTISNINDKVPIMHIPGFTFPVKEFYKNEFETSLRDGYIPINLHSRNKNNGEDDFIDEDYDNNGSCVVRDRDRQKIYFNTFFNVQRELIDYELIILLVMNLSGYLHPNQSQSNEMLAEAHGSVLIFFPGIQEIYKFISACQHFYHQLKGHAKNKKQIEFIALHSGTSPTEQRRLFQTSQQQAARVLRVIAATNIAEASVTIPDTTVVIDTCRVKQLHFDELQQSSRLIMSFAAQDALRQRRGRAGRTSAGRCFRCVTLNTFQDSKKIPLLSIPEILRISLENVLLQAWMIITNSSTPNTNGNDRLSNRSKVRELLSHCIDIPDTSKFSASELLLEQVNALDISADCVTALGKHLNNFSCDLRAAKLLIYGALLHCVLASLSVASMLSGKSPFLTNNTNNSNSNNNTNGSNGLVDRLKEKLQRSRCPTSDYQLLVEVMLAYLDTPKSQRRKFCQSAGLSFDRMVEIQQSMSDLADDLVGAGFLPSKDAAFDTRSVFNSNISKLQLVTAVYTAGLYPQLVQVVRPPKKFIEVMGSALERDSEAREFQFFAPTLSSASDTSAADASTKEDDNANVAPASAIVGFLQRNVILSKEIAGSFTRVFVHPSSINFNNTSYQWSNYLLFGEKSQQSGTMSTSSKSSNINNNSYGNKIYVRSTCEVNAISLVLFGGKIDYIQEDNMLVIDRWIRFQCSERVYRVISHVKEQLQKVLEYQISISFADTDDVGKTGGTVAVVDEDEQNKIIAIVTDLLEDTNATLHS